jgi:hypothetical protein
VENDMLPFIPVNIEMATRISYASSDDVKMTVEELEIEVWINELLESDYDRLDIIAPWSSKIQSTVFLTLIQKAVAKREDVSVNVYSGYDWVTKGYNNEMKPGRYVFFPN